MEDERCSSGYKLTDGIAASSPVTQGDVQHPTQQADAARVSDPPQDKESQQVSVSSAALYHHNGDPEIAVNGNGASCRALMPDAQLPSAPTFDKSDVNEGTGGDEAGTSTGFESGPATETVHNDAAEMEAKVDGGSHASSAIDMADAGAGAEEVAGESNAGAVAQPVDGNTSNALVEEAGDAGGAESDGKESNDSVCNECGGGGEVVCCDGCVKSYHTDCLPVAARPRLRANADDWFCPDCSSSPAAAAPAAVVPPPGPPKAPQGLPDSRGSRQNTAPASPSPVYPAMSSTTPWSALPSCVPTRRRKTKATEDYETRINVGPNHQVPHLPDFFLARGDGDSLSSVAEQSLADGAQNQALGPLLVYSPYLMERSKQQCMSERAAKSCITSQKDLAEFLIKCSKRWKVRPGWQPFSPEFAYKLLHRANYDPERALRMMDDSAFWTRASHASGTPRCAYFSLFICSGCLHAVVRSFQSICDPPLRKYENKWKRRDKRGTFPSSPYPPPVVVRGYLNEKQRQLRMGR